METTNLRLSNGLEIPQLGFGTSGLHSATSSILHALQSGYRHIDTADIYETHENVAEAIQKSGVKREEIFITTKLWSHSLSSKRVGPAVDRFLKELQTEYIDLLLIHWPGNTPVKETLGAMEVVRKSGKVKSLGVSNFNADLVQEAMDTGYPIVNDQIEFNLNHRPQDVLDFCTTSEITVTAYSPMENGNQGQENLVADLARKYSATRAEVLLRWLMQKGMIAIPRSSEAEHIQNNLHALEWKMDDGDVKQIDELG